MTRRKLVTKTRNDVTVHEYENGMMTPKAIDC